MQDKFPTENHVSEYPAEGNGYIVNVTGCPSQQQQVMS
jgi:hypothetical protein